MKSEFKIKASAFTLKVIEITKKIPRGKVATYGQVASLAGKPGAARGVGWILNSCSETHKLPWQRVLNAKGKISFPRKSEEFKNQKKLLQREGVRVSLTGELDLEKYRWRKQPRKTKTRGPQMFS